MWKGKANSLTGKVTLLTKWRSWGSDPGDSTADRPPSPELFSLEAFGYAVPSASVYPLRPIWNTSLHEASPVVQLGVIAFSHLP